MKTISSRFLKGALAILLVVVMLFGSTITGSAAVVDNADTKANVDIADVEANVDIATSGLTIPTGSGNLVMFNNTLGWSNVYLYTRNSDLWNGGNGCTTSNLTGIAMTRIGTTSFWYTYISTNYKYVLFLKDKQDNYGNVWSTSASYRTDYSTSYPCFTPIPWNHESTNSTTYYSKGSWSKFDDTATELSVNSGSGKLVIFNNTLGWSNVYFYSKSSNFYTNNNGCSTSNLTGTLMNRISDTNYWYIYTSTTSHMLFMKDKQDNYGNLWQTAACYKEDYTDDHQIFTPNTTAVETANSTSYYSNGTWSKYAEAANKHTVKFVDYNGNVLSTQEVEDGKTPTAPSDPSREGYTFTGWDPAIGAITADTTYTAQYDINTYTVKYDVGDGTGTFADQTKTHGESITLHSTAPTPPDKYIFSGWSDGSGNVYQAGDTYSADANVTLTAQYEQNEFTATFKNYDGTVLATQEVTKNNTPNAPSVPDRTGYIFAGWDPQVGAMTSDKIFTATYTPIEYTITFNTDGGSSIASITYTIESPDFELPTPTKTGYDFLKWVDAGGNEYSTIETGSYGNLELTAVYTLLYYAIVEGDTVTSSDYYGAGKEVTLKFDVPTGQYLKSVTAAPAMTLTDDNIDKENGTVTFTMPENNVTFSPDYGDMYMVNFSDDIFTSTTNKGYYCPGDAVTIEVTPKGGHVITDVTSEQTAVTYANQVITFTMPAENVTLDVEYSASFKAYSEVTTVHIDPDGPNVHTGYDNRVQGGTVTMTCNDATLAEGGFADGDVTYTAAPSTNYKFVGFFADENFNKLLSNETTYTVSPESDVTVYALFARRQYIRFDTNSWLEMTYDYSKKSYVMVYDNTNLGTGFSNGYQLFVTYDKNKPKAYSDWGSADFSVSMNKNSYARTISWDSSTSGTWYLGSAQANTALPLTIMVKPESITKHNKIDVSARAKKTGATVFLSDGRWLNFNSSTTILTEDVTGEDKVIGHDGDSEEYKKINLAEFKTLSWETTINHADAEYLYVDSYIVYKLEDKSWEIVEPVSLGNNKYQGTVYVDGDCYIVPIFFYNDQYCEDNDYVNIELYFDASAIQNLNWGPFVSVYAWGASDEEYYGAWPGQLMIPTPDGKSFYTQMTVPKAGSTNPAAGVTFNNYLYCTCPTQEADTFGLGTTNVQTYDYREAITLYESGYDVITFVAKTSKDGYHGDEPNGVTQNVISSDTSSTDLFSNFEFDYLFCRDGVTPMDFTGNPVADTSTVKTLDSADYYVVSKGDRDIDAGGYSADLSYNGNWSVEWYIFDSNGTYKTKVLSTALWHDTTPTDDVHKTVLMAALGLDPEDVAGKTVAISYELANHADGDEHKLAYDGQWYGNMLDDTVTGQVKVGFQNDPDSPFEIDDDDKPNIADYGEAYLMDADGNGHQTLEIEIEYGIADIKAVVNDGYIFVGWYTQKADGSYVKVSNALVDDPYINMNETYYAIFRPMGEGEVVINHSTYHNPDDPAIPSHGGTAEMSVIVTDTETDEVFTSTPSTSRSTVAFEGVEGHTYKVKIITTPLINGEFFAWYTDSLEADGTKTYEEILTEETHKYSTTTVEAEFEYVYDPAQTTINIYSDVKRVSNEATIIYKYFNRFGNLCTYTVKNVPLTDDECLGYVGNGGEAYVPTYYTLLKYDEADGRPDVYVLPEEVDDSQYAGYSESYNMIQAYAPNPDITEAFNKDIIWKFDTEFFTPEKNMLTVWADQEAPEYTVNYTMGSESGSQTGVYNDLIKIKAPATFDGKEFSYWWEPATEEILCYTTYYNYRIVENKTIEAVYGVNVTQPWTPSINSVTYTREFADDHDIVYTDYLLAFNNKDAKILKEVQESENLRFGLLVYREENYFIEDSDNIKYPAAPASNAQLEDYLKRTARDKQKNMAFTVEGTRYNCYYYNLTDKVDNLTVFNRIDYYLGYHNDFVVYTNTETKKDYYYHNYAFKAVAYIIDANGNVYLSTPKDVDFYDLGTTPVDSDSGN